MKVLRFTGPARTPELALAGIAQVDVWRFARTSNVAAPGGTPWLFESMGNRGPGGMVMVLADWWTPTDLDLHGVGYETISLGDGRYEEVLGEIVTRSVSYLCEPLTMSDVIASVRSLTASND